ncbi:cell division protein FtsZ [Mycoplasma mycoides subsp. mycoides]|uniref:Cell division protein FtsZ n=2 Tax=Mycoplasma mycoides subsp. mycoides TaxID=2103 RepID=Q6MT25_MYCMS|nr:cell division protein FtsZ [Mycoplasma mycoides]CAE77211.1 cell division protein ftsZ [Mycoplasma mycoides subsp. mycoides SC str. PG1]ADK70067.1 cell division protein FtsZ [Mycoplasma mycoides subsp. mycoides SC str. Gladysdale]AIZ55446.1 cell division protein FtsZ [Mycoplasma mycoides subsp. mycoides]AME10796.1 cell division protein FtsZ [Mycoplasma mycoides subsp. mycoides]AME11803.1 cell division protein FtsZ [Mycoplasma mycoides subsp. mycoides]
MTNEFKQIARIKVLGVGGAGNNAIRRMFEENVQGVEFYIINTDAQILESSPVPNKIILGEKTTKGLGAGGNPEVGKAAAIESEEELRKVVEGADLIFIAAGMGGGTGTGAAPVIAKIAQESGALVIGIVTKPFIFEGRHRNVNAKEGLEELRKYVDSVIVVSNDKLLEYIGSIPIVESFKEADTILKQGVQTITDLIAVPATINLDFADVKSVMSKKGNALFGIGVASGKDKAVEAAKEAINSKLLEASIEGAKDIIVNITGGRTVSLNDAYDAVGVISQAVNNKELNIVFGMAINDDLTDDDEIIVTVIATGFENKNLQNQESNIIKTPRVEPVVQQAQPSKPIQQEQEEEQHEEVDEFDDEMSLTTTDDTEEDFNDDDFPTFLK